MPSAIDRQPELAGYRGLEQFAARGAVEDIGYCHAGGTPYSLEFSNDADVICLLLGDIQTETEFEDDGERPLVFAGESSAFHPRGGNVRVRAHQVRHGFLAFSYAPRFQSIVDDVDIGRIRQRGSCNNIRQDSIGSLARYARSRIASRDPLRPFELQSLAALVYLETVRRLGSGTERPRQGLSDREFAEISAFIDAELASEITCAGLAKAAGVPLRVVFDGMKLRTGLSPYRFVTERRLERARQLLSTSRLPISEIALACGFSSQQHLTSALSAKLGTTPLKIRKRG